MYSCWNEFHRFIFINHHLLVSNSKNSQLAGTCCHDVHYTPQNIQNIPVYVYAYI